MGTGAHQVAKDYIEFCARKSDKYGGKKHIAVVTKDGFRCELSP